MPLAAGFEEEVGKGENRVKSLEMDSFSAVRFLFRGFFFFLLVSVLPNLFIAHVHMWVLHV